MVDADRRPTAQEIEELIDLVRRDASSPAFIDLGEAYLALGRPRDAIAVANLGLEASPDNLEGRVMLARAFAALHQWKEAQGELLRVVKIDRSSRQGFALLGEVLMRRNDYERAVPVLQHAQNLDPTSPAILSMLRRARAGQQLDPPTPIPTPVAPRGETNNPAMEVERSPRKARSGPIAAQARAESPTLAPPRRSQPIAAQPAAPQPVAAAPSAPAPLRRSVERPAAPPPEPARKLGGLDALTAGMPEPEPPPPPPLPRPTERAAPAPLARAPMPSEELPLVPSKPAPPRRKQPVSARRRAEPAVGENYLNDLLTGGTFTSPPEDVHFDVRADKRWGRSTRNAFIFLFIVLVLGIGGGGTWYWWTEKQKAEKIAELQTEAKAAVGNADYSGLGEAVSKMLAAREIDPTNKQTYAYFIEAGGLASLLYGEERMASPTDPTKALVVGPEQVDAAIVVITQNEDKLQPTDVGWREYVIGKVALELARLPNERNKPEVVASQVGKVTEANKLLDAYIDTAKDDKWALWLRARTQLAFGNRRGAAAILKPLSEGGDALLVAQVDYANLLVDDGKVDDALKLFKAALDKQHTHPLALLGNALARAEASLDVSETVGELNSQFVNDKNSSRVSAYRYLTLAIANMNIEEYPAATEALAKATINKPPAEPRFWSRIAWAHYKLGRRANPDLKQKSDLEEADLAFGRCLYYSKSPEADPTMQLVDAGLSFARGLPDKTLDTMLKSTDLRSRLLKAYAYLDLGKAKEAFDETTEILKSAKGASGKVCEEGNEQANIEARILCEQARMLAADVPNDKAKEKERKDATEALLDLARKARSKLGHHALGMAYLATNDIPNAKEQLNQATSGISDASPNPLEYRSLTALAEIALAEKDLTAANDLVQKSLAVNLGYFPTKAVLARILVRNKEVEKAEPLLAQILAEPSANTPAVQLTLAESLVVKKDPTDKDKENATNILTAIKGKPGISDEDIGRIAVMIDPKLPEKLGVPVPADPAKPGEAPKPAPKLPKRPGKR